MKNLFLTIMIITAFAGNAQERVNAALPKISSVTRGKLTEATGWNQDKAGQWISRKNKIPVSLAPDMQSLVDFEEKGLGENNFVYLELRDVTIADSTYLILIRKYKDGFYQYPSIKKGWQPQTSLEYFVFRPKELEKLKNPEQDKTTSILLHPLYSNKILFLSPTASLKTIEEDLVAVMAKRSKPIFPEDAIIRVKPYKDMIRFTVYKGVDYNGDNFKNVNTIDLTGHYYETPRNIFTKFILL